VVGMLILNARKEKNFTSDFLLDDVEPITQFMLVVNKNGLEAVLN
jgi:hypothetical protein